jgi:hypothetical protein
MSGQEKDALSVWSPAFTTAGAEPDVESSVARSLRGCLGCLLDLRVAGFPAGSGRDRVIADRTVENTPG